MATIVFLCVPSGIQSVVIVLYGMFTLLDVVSLGVCSRMA